MLPFPVGDRDVLLGIIEETPVWISGPQFDAWKHTQLIIDVVAGRLAYRGLDRGLSVATTDLNIHYLAPVVDGPARAQARVLRRGRRMIVLSVDVYDVATGQLAAASTITFAVVSMPKQEAP